MKSEETMKDDFFLIKRYLAGEKSGFEELVRLQSAKEEVMGQNGGSYQNINGMKLILKLHEEAIKMMKRFFLTSLILFLTISPLYAMSPLGGGGGPFIKYNFHNMRDIDKDFTGNFLLFGGKGFCIKTEKIRIGGGGCGGPLLAKDSDVAGGMGYGGFILEYFFHPKISTSILIGGGGYTLEKTLKKTGNILELKRKEGKFFALEPAVSLQLLSRESKIKEIEECYGKPFFETYLLASYLWANVGGKNIGGPMLGFQFIFGGK